MDDLIARIRAAIDEDERIARRAADAHEGSPDWRFVPGNEDVEPAAFLGRRSLYSDYHGDEGLMPSEVEHIARHDPARVLRQVAAHRKILELHSPGPIVERGVIERRQIQQCEYCASLCHSRSGLGCEDPADAVYPCETVTLLAEAYGIEEI